MLIYFFILLTRIENAVDLFFFQAEDGIRAATVTGVQTCALPIYRIRRAGLVYLPEGRGILPGLTVHENLRMAMRLAGSTDDRTTAVDRTITLFPVLGQRLKQR